jgi:hypothetical protein
MPVRALPSADRPPTGSIWIYEIEHDGSADGAPRLGRHPSHHLTGQRVVRPLSAGVLPDRQGGGVLRWRGAISSLVGKQSKHSRNYRQSNQSTDDERYNWMSTGFELLRTSAFLRRSDAQPKGEIAH